LSIGNQQIKSPLPFACCLATVFCGFVSNAGIRDVLLFFFLQKKLFGVIFFKEKDNEMRLVKRRFCGLMSAKNAVN